MYKFFKWELSGEETFVGFMINWPFFFIFGWWVLLIMAICGLLWALGGAEHSSKLVRRAGIPILLCLCLLFNGRYMLGTLGCLGAYGVLTLGYGENSWLYKRFKEDDFMIRLCTYVLYYINFGIAGYLQKVITWTI